MSEPVVVYKTRGDAILPRDASAIARRPLGEGVEHARRPLGLGIVADNDNGDEPPAHGDGVPDAYLGPERTAAAIVAQSIANLSEEQLAAPVSWRELFEHAIGMTIQQSFEDGDFLRGKLRELRKEITDGQAAHRNEISEMKAALTEARGEVAAMRSIQEAARALNRGERGETGPRGVPGSQGPIGPAGPKGEPGVKAAGFVLDIGGYAATLISSDGAPAARLSLRPMFEQFATEIAAEDGE